MKNKQIKEKLTQSGLLTSEQLKETTELQQLIIIGLKIIELLEKKK